MVDVLNHLTPKRIERFMSHVDRSGDDCWLWTGCRGNHGYGVVSMGRNGKTAMLQTSHRIAWTLAHGLPLAGYHVLHKCGNPRCCNPNHLYLGDDKDNARDAKQHGTTFFKGHHGEGHHKAKLTEHDVSLIRELRKNGETQVELSNRFDVSRRNIRSIIDRKTWRMVQ